MAVLEAEFPQAQPDLVVFDDHPGQLTPGPLPHQTASPSSPARNAPDAASCAADPPRHAHALVSQGDARTAARARVGTSRARAAAAGSTHHVVLGHQAPQHVRQQKKIQKARGRPALRAQMGSPPAADTRPDVLQQTRAVQGAGAALPRCLGPRSADLQRPCRVGSKSGREGRRGAAAQHTHYGAVHRDTGKPRAMRSSSAPPGACTCCARCTRSLPDSLPVLCPIFGKANSREFSAQKIFNNIKRL
jgi:hypothetical protein